MNKLIKLSILFIIISIDLIGQTNSNEYTFKNSIMYLEGKKVGSYNNANGEIIFFKKADDGKYRIELKVYIAALDANQILNIESLSNDIVYIRMGRNFVNKKNKDLSTSIIIRTIHRTLL